MFSGLLRSGIVGTQHIKDVYEKRFQMRGKF